MRSVHYLSCRVRRGDPFWLHNPSCARLFQQTLLSALVDTCTENNTRRAARWQQRPMGSSAFYRRFIFIIRVYIYSLSTRAYPLNLVLNYKLVCHIKSSTDSTSQIIQRAGDGTKMQRTQAEIFCTLSSALRQAENQFVRPPRRVIYFCSMKAGELVCVLWVSRVIGSQMRKHSLSCFWGWWLDLSKFLNCSRLCIMCRVLEFFLCSLVTREEIENNGFKEVRNCFSEDRFMIWFLSNLDLLHLRLMRWQEAINETK